MQGSKGLVRMSVGTGLLAIGPWTRITVQVLDSSEHLDVSAAGALTATADEGVQIAWVDPVAAGVSSLIARPLSPGPHLIQLAFADGRSGKREIYGYPSQLRVIDMSIDTDDWNQMLADPYGRDEFPCSVVVDGQSRPGATVKLHGGTSSDAPKRSFRIDLKKGDGLADGRRKLILRSEYIDKTLLRTWLSYDIIRLTTWLPAPSYEFVHFRVNQRLYGVMGLVERVDDNYLKQRGRNPLGALYEADPPTQLGSPGGALVPLFPASAYPLVYDKHSGSSGYDDLRALVERVLLLPQAQFDQQAPGILKVGDFLIYAAVMSVIQNQEHLRKNYYLFRDETGADQRWEFLAWDLDMSWGHLWTDINDAMDETIFADLTPEKGHKSVDSVFYNQMYRVLGNAQWHEVWRQGVLRIADSVLTPAYFEPRIQAQLCRIGPDLLADAHKRGSNEEFLQRVDELRLFAKSRLAFLHQELGDP